MESKRLVSNHQRNTAETQITLSLNVDGSGAFSGSCGIPFMDHMLHLFARHGCFDLELNATGDTAVDYHHLVEDLGITLGEAFKTALGDKKGIIRYGSCILPMDETLVTCALDLSNRAFLVYRVAFEVRFIRDFNAMLLREFFQGFANTVGANLHFILHHGDEPHHIAEAQFKAFARALDQATRLDPRIEGRLPSTKEKL
jgi:imidazoleglycerol-phosphate dehydratase